MVRRINISLAIAAVLGVSTMCGLVHAAEGSGPIGYWKLDEGGGTIAYDRVGGRHGTVYGAEWTSGRVEGALKFDGVDDYVDCGDMDVLDGCRQLTFTAWVRPLALTDWGTIVSKCQLLESRTQFGLSSGGVGGNDDVIVMVCNGENSYGYTTGNIIKAGVWRHWAMVFDSSQTGNPNRLKFYLDGEEQSLRFSGTIPSVTCDNSAIVAIGAQEPTVSPFNGTIDEVRIYNRALSGEETTQLYREGVGRYQLAVGEMMEAAAEKQEVLERIAAGVERDNVIYEMLEELLTSGRYGQLSYDDVLQARERIQSAMDYQERSMKALEGSIEKVYDGLSALGWEPPPAPEPIGHWKLDEISGATAHDSAGDNNGTLVNGPVWTTGLVGGALRFDGVDDYIKLGNDSSLKPQLPVTISAWIKLSKLGGQVIVTLDEQSKRYYGIWFQVSTKNRLEGSFGDGRGGDWSRYRRSKAGATVLQTGVWYHVAAVLRGAEDIQLYINGADDKGSYSGRGGGLSYSDSDSYMASRSGLRSFFGGLIDDVRIYDKALSGEEIRQLYQNCL